MTELYWMFVLGNLSNGFIIAAVLLILSSALMSIKRSVDAEVISTEDEKKTFKEEGRIINAMIGVSLTLLILSLFLPTKKELMVIYGVGGTIDYIQSSDEAKKLPDNCIKAANKFVESYLDEENE